MGWWSWHPSCSSQRKVYFLPSRETKPSEGVCCISPHQDTGNRFSLSRLRLILCGMEMFSQKEGEKNCVTEGQFCENYQSYWGLFQDSWTSHSCVYICDHWTFDSWDTLFPLNEDWRLTSLFWLTFRTTDLHGSRYPVFRHAISLACLPIPSKQAQSSTLYRDTTGPGRLLWQQVFPSAPVSRMT